MLKGFLSVILLIVITIWTFYLLNNSRTLYSIFKRDALEQTSEVKK